MFPDLFALLEGNILTEKTATRSIIFTQDCRKSRCVPLKKQRQKVVNGFHIYSAEKNERLLRQLKLERCVECMLVIVLYVI
ncbi:uncharacterized protein V6R79_018229 [Siganus canaliculatus]